ncbi:MAG: helix-turn-helix domain-containing protein [Anaerolineae bacterium]|nr:helix-turn-helix domain-containing protein [Anaerolineae bacterium]
MDDQLLLVTVAEAARRFGKSPRTIRRWLAEGRLPVAETPVGKMVDLSGFARPGEERPAARTDGQKSPDVAALELQVARLQGEVAKLDALVQQATGERDYLRQALTAALGTVEALHATPLLPAERATAEPHPWWRFWKRP